MSVFLAYVLKPFVLFGLLVLIYPIKWAIGRYMKDGKLKRLLLSRI